MAQDAQQIIEIARATRAHLSSLQLDLEVDIEAIEQTAFSEDRALTPAETTRHDQLRAALGETHEAFRELGFVTLQTLDSSTAVRRLLADIKDVNRQIESDLHRLQSIAKFAQTASSILDGLAKLAAGLASLA